jgi:hypothetical protein
MDGNNTGLDARSGPVGRIMELPREQTAKVSDSV